jgi:cyclomaltodextrinase / maltogenic alpha-amylase / neopullulanase
MDDFIFGTLATDEARSAEMRGRRAGVTHFHQRTPRDPLPGRPVSIALTVGPTYPATSAWVYWTNDGSDPAGAGGQATQGQATALAPTEAEWDTLLWGYVQNFRGEIPGQPAGTVVRYRVAAAGAAGETVADAGTYYGYYVDDDPPPDWARDAIIYQIFVDRFYDTDPKFPRILPKPSLQGNGRLRGITAQLDYVAALGVNCLWLTPIFPSPSYHGYDASDIFEINPRLGTKADFKELIDQAHARQLRVLMDFVPNHWSDQHPSFVTAHSERTSPYAAWYTFDDSPAGYQTFFGVKDLPQLNLRHPAAREHVLEAARYWLEFGVDGFRVDYCIGPTPDFYADFRRVTRAAKPDCWTFGEAVDPPDRQIAFEGGMDGTLDFMLLEALRQTFGFGLWDGRRFADFLDRHEAYFPVSFSRPSFLDNHDMNRFLWLAQGDRRQLKLAALCQFALAGPPIIYYGTEVGLSQARDIRQGGWALHEEARLPMPWGKAQDSALLEFYSALCRVRREHPALRRGQRETLRADERTLAFRRGAGAESVVAVLNLAQAPAEFTLPITERVIALATSRDCHVRLEAEQVVVSLPPLGGLLLTH